MEGENEAERIGDSALSMHQAAFNTQKGHDTAKTCGKPPPPKRLKRMISRKRNSTVYSTRAISLTSLLRVKKSLEKALGILHGQNYHQLLCKMTVISPLMREKFGWLNYGFRKN